MDKHTSDNAEKGIPPPPPPPKNEEKNRSTGHGVLGVDEIEVKYSSPRTSPRHDAQRRRWLSSTAASLMDEPEEEEDEEDGIVEPGLEVITDDENSSVSSKANSEQGEPKSRAIVTLTTPDEEIGVEPEATSPLARFSANMTGMASYLCPMDSFRDDEGAIMIQSNRTLSQRDLKKTQRKQHQRIGSETDVLQMMLSSGPCGTSSMYGNSTTDPDRSIRDPTSPLHTGGTHCTDMNMGEMRQIIVSDISSLLGTSSGAAGDEWGCAVQSWLVTRPPPGVNTGRRRTVRNRCALRNAQAQRVRKLWQKWHSREVGAGLPNASPRSPHRSFDDVHCIPEQSPPLEVVDFYYDSDPEMFTTSHRTQHHTSSRPGPIVCNGSFGSTGYGPCPTTPKAAHRKRFSSFDSKSSVETTSAKHSHSSDVARFDLWDDQKVKQFVKVR